jgi:hypothetical protein
MCIDRNLFWCRGWGRLNKWGAVLVLLLVGFDMGMNLGDDWIQDRHLLLHPTTKLQTGIKSKGINSDPPLIP